MSEERYKLIKENVYTRCHIAEYTGIGLSCPDKEEIELIDYVEELKDQLQQKENIIKEAREYIDKYLEREYFDTDILENNTIYNRDLYKVLKILDKAGNSNERNKDNK